MLTKLTVFYGAFLLFTMEPLVGRLLTPYFGGASHVWLTCLMFFQAMLFLGYLYAHLIEKKIGAWHLILLLVPFFVLPLDITAKTDAGAPLTTILIILIFRVALPFIVLSTTAVVAQSWFYRSYLGRSKEPYPLYGASNAGSLLALLGYVFVIEPLLGVRVQRFAWSGAYVCYVILVAATWFALRPGTSSTFSDESQEMYHGRIPTTPNVVQYLRWFLLSGLPSALLLAVTNYIALEVGSFPLVWVVPLALYLASFIVTFRTAGGVPVFLHLLWLEILLTALALYAFGPAHWILILGHLCVFFMICLVSHGLLFDNRPAAVKLTNFYLASAFGGWLGGALVAFVAPFAFSGFYEYPLALILSGIVFWWCRSKAFTDFWVRASRLAAYTRMALIGILVFPLGLGIQSYRAEGTQFRHRNFYGTYRIVDTPEKNNSPAIRRLIHGTTLHGAQLLNPGARMTPISYYYDGGHISDVYRATPSPVRAAVVGLGSGAISTYMGRDDMLTYFEIDPDNEEIARTWFTYMTDSKTNVKVVVGDGRLSLQKQRNYETRYDLITVDAFTGDGIPTHLLTREAIQIFFDNLTEKGMLLLHISNRYYDLRPIVKATALSLKLTGVFTSTEHKRILKPYEQYSWCAVLASNPGLLKPLVKKGWIPFGEDDGLPQVLPWTDDYINILSPISIMVKNQIRGLLSK